MFGKISLPISLYHKPPLLWLFYGKVQKRFKIQEKITKITPILLYYDPYILLFWSCSTPPTLLHPYPFFLSLLIIPPLQLGTWEYETKCIKNMFVFLELLAIEIADLRLLKSIIFKYCNSWFCCWWETEDRNV